jgi:hypothetical protein
LSAFEGIVKQLQMKHFVLTESSWDSDDQSLSTCDLLSQVDLVPRRVLNQNIKCRDLVANFDEGTGGAVK